jgi:hypothetical protein
VIQKLLMTITKMVPTGADIFQIVAMGDIKVLSILGLICTVIHFQMLQLQMKYKKLILISILKKFHGLVIQLKSLLKIPLKPIKLNILLQTMRLIF